MHPCIETITTIRKVTNRTKMVIHVPVPSFFSQPQLIYFYNLVQFYRSVTRVPSQSVQSLQASQNFSWGDYQTHYESPFLPSSGADKCDLWAHLYVFDKNKEKHQNQYNATPINRLSIVPAQHTRHYQIVFWSRASALSSAVTSSISFSQLQWVLRPWQWFRGAFDVTD